eukprot:TRINITY_DN856_c0_g1_i1.p1 TRINITY_DN856_c0_g1~~TRINITY_DN856_c0_g1_i1.p1  ORF type:complete len:509 (-),score=59.32 TRINITY_DN856_c0_g1_i1:74-1600(-)
MAYTALHPDQVEEYFDSEDILQKSAQNLAQLLRESHHAVIFTGAGISTLCGIPDFRGPKGVWTLAAAGETRKEQVTVATKAIPSFAHMAIVELIKRGIVKFVISQNCDGLHRKSGIPPHMISELHGNRNLERCTSCGKEYLRDYDAVASYIFSVSDHRTSRKCVVCGEQLIDSIINFGDNLPQQQLDSAWANTKSSDLFLVIGSSLTVAPACHMPQHVGEKKKGNLVICNLQNTPLDNIAKVRIHSRSDDLMKLVMQHLGITVPSFHLTRYVGINVDANKSAVHVYGIDTDGTPATWFPEIYINQKKLDAEPFVTEFSERQQNLEIQLTFYGHYNEPIVNLNTPCDYSHRNYFEMKYQPLTGIWEVSDKGISPPACFGSKYQPPPFPTDSVKTKTSAGFSVQPREDCPHFQSEVFLGTSSMITGAYQHNQCCQCHDSSENWQCLTCGKTFCSRYVNGHAKLHSEETGHHIALSFSDLSVWCYACGEYIKDKLLTTMFVGELYKAKFDV